ncbi:polysaccharide deacetylase family protein [Thermicanus aegyptius]|uniref:polysaccharide deacetylase family protein n=1 Tax=Thermicanus aegyptius TaxID=94009 RepID=UPI000418A18B|nr:polysaccharide deacetylase family protein [Thermicanus aegyptius]
MRRMLFFFLSLSLCLPQMISVQPAISPQPSLLAFALQEMGSPSSLNRKYPHLFIMKGKGTAKEVALTFDDAPDLRYTPQILTILKKENVKATFFVVGWRAKAYPSVVKRIIQDGHVLGNHSYSHADLAKVSQKRFQYETEKTDEIIKRLSGYSPKLLRPPYGSIKESQLRWAAQKKYVVVYWNVDSEDWRGIGAKEVIHNVLDHVGVGSIILHHSGTGRGGDLSGTVKALPVIIKNLKREGYRFVTVPELLHIPRNK